MHKIEMFRIKEVEERIKVPCEWCLAKGIVYDGCSKCGGKGVHHKTIKIWKIAKHKEDVIAIDRNSEGTLRFWTSPSEYFPEDRRLVHFTKTDAENECKRRNKELLPIIEIMNKNKFSVAKED